MQVSKISEFLAYMNAVLLRRNIWLWVNIDTLLNGCSSFVKLKIVNLLDNLYLFHQNTPIIQFHLQWKETKMNTVTIYIAIPSVQNIYIDTYNHCEYKLYSTKWVLAMINDASQNDMIFSKFVNLLSSII